MSRYLVQAFGPEGLRGFADTSETTKAEVLDFLTTLPDVVDQWTEWGSISIAVWIGRGKKPFNSKCYAEHGLTSVEAVREYVDQILRENR